MTKIQGAGLLLGLLVLLAPAATAHGAPTPRGIDTRVLHDDDGTVPYGGCVEGTCLTEGGLDVLALDVREANFPDGAPAIVFRLITQTESPGAATITLTLTAGGSERTYTATTPDGQAFVPNGFTRLDGPFDVGDGHPKALDGWVRSADLGVQAGDTITDITLQSARESGPDDIMPGTWYMQGQTVPGAETTPGEYVVKGPAELVKLTADPASVQAPGTTTIRITNAVDLSQFTDLAITGDATVDLDAVNLDGNGARDVTLSIGPKASGVVRITAVSDLGAYATLDIPVTAAPVATPTNSTEHEEHDHDHDEQDAPAPAVVPLALAAALILRRLRK
jgi:hypothetical protein